MAAATSHHIQTRSMLRAEAVDEATGLPGGAPAGVLLARLDAEKPGLSLLDILAEAPVSVDNGFAVRLGSPTVAESNCVSPLMMSASLDNANDIVVPDMVMGLLPGESIAAVSTT